MLLVYLTRDGERSWLEARKMRQGKERKSTRASVIPKLADALCHWNSFTAEDPLEEPHRA